MKRWFLLGALASTPACIAPSVVSSAGRSVNTAVAEISWRAPARSDLIGFFESERIEGESAQAVGKLYYSFADDGTFSGAALVLGGQRPEFQTLTGAWTLAENRLDLGDGEPIELSAADGRVRLSSSAGVAVLRRIAFD